MKSLSTNQKIAVWGIVVPAAISLVGLIFQGKQVDVKLQPVIEMKPVINNVINNITEVKKEVANLKDAVKQQYGLWESETFGKPHLDHSVKKLNRPPTAPRENASFVFLELKKIPLQNSLQISTERGVTAPGTTRTSGNIVTMKFLGSVDRILADDTDFINARYIADWEDDTPLRTLEGATFMYQCNEEGECEIRFNEPIRQLEKSVPGAEETD